VANIRGALADPPARWVDEANLQLAPYSDDADDDPASALRHALPGGIDDIYVREELGVERFAPYCRVQFIRRSSLRCASRIHQNVDRPEAVFDRFDHSLRRHGVHQISDDAKRLLDLGAGLVDIVAGARTDGDPRALSRKAHGASRPYALRATGDEHDFVFESELNRPCLREFRSAMGRSSNAVASAELRPVRHQQD
jgi:hypothetical protein